MKKLFVALIVLTPFIGVSQDIDKGINGVYSIYVIPDKKPDTLSAYLLVTTRNKGIASQKRGFVVSKYGKDYIYLDCDKKVIKPPFNVWQFRIIKQPK